MHNIITIRSTRFFCNLLFLLSFVALFSSCRRDEERSQWDTEIITPLMKSTLSIIDLLNDTSVLADADSSLKLVYQNHLYDISLDSLFSIPDTGVRKVYNIDSISLLNQRITYPVTLAYVANSAGVLGQAILANQGASVVIPAYNFAVLPPEFSINADSLFKTITLITGFIDISIFNGFPIDINNLIFSLKDSITGIVLAQDTFPLIAVGQTQTKTVNLAGKTINSILVGKILSMTTPGSGGNQVLIDTTDALVADLRIYDLHPSYATAIFPTQNLIDKSQAFKFNLAPVQLKEAVVDGGQIAIDLFSTLQDSVHFTYKLPNATLNGVPFEISHTLPPAPPGGVSQYSSTYSFAGYHLDMRGDLSIGQDTVNTMFNIFQARVDSTGQMRTLSTADSLFADIRFEQLRPSYARGYLGQDTFNFGPSSVYIDLFKNINATNFQLQDVKMSFDIENNIGLDGDVLLQNLKSVNTRNNQTVVLSGSALNNPIVIPRAIDPGGFNAIPSIPTYANYVLSGSNSNAPAFVSNLPDRIDYSLELHTNPQGNQNYIDFIYLDKLMKFDLNLEIPLHFLADDLTLMDTVEITVNAIDLSRIQSGTLTLIANNGFPFDAKVQLFVLDQFNNITDSLFTNNIILAAPINANGRVTEKKRSKLVMPVSQDQIYAFLNDAKRIKVISHFTTKPVGQTVRIYSDYQLDLKLTGDFNYRAN